jgi:hypothetical protein
MILDPSRLTGPAGPSQADRRPGPRTFARLLGKAGLGLNREKQGYPGAFTIMGEIKRSASPTILLRISDGSVHMHRSFNDFPQAERSAQAFAGAGFAVAMMSATGRFLMGYEPGAAAMAGGI